MYQPSRGTCPGRLEEVLRPRQGGLPELIWNFPSISKLKDLKSLELSNFVTHGAALGRDGKILLELPKVQQQGSSTNWFTTFPLEHPSSLPSKGADSHSAVFFQFDPQAGFFMQPAQTHDR